MLLAFGPHLSDGWSMICARMLQAWKGHCWVRSLPQDAGYEPVGEIEISWNGEHPSSEAVKDLDIPYSDFWQMVASPPASGFSSVKCRLGKKGVELHYST